MIRTNRDPRRAATDLRRVIEPLASYICASERPRAALSQALAVLAGEVSDLNRIASGHVNRLARTAADR